MIPPVHSVCAGFLSLVVAVSGALAQHRHQTILHDQPSAVKHGGTLVRGLINAPPFVAQLDPAAAPDGGAEFVSPVIDAPFPFNEALVSWNLDLPPAAGVRIDMRVADSAGVWSPWLYLGRWGDAVVPGERPQKFDGGKVDVDYFVSPAPAKFSAFQYRIQAIRTAAGGPVGIRRVAVTFSDTGPGAKPEPTAHSTRKPSPGRLGVPFRSQKTDDDKLDGRLCSPTSVSMVMAHRGVDRPVKDVAAAAYDADFNIYGNWPRNVQAAYAMGVPGYLTRFSNWAEVEAMLARGQPLIVSIFVEKGQLRNAPYDKTSGHLIVIEGVNEHGDLLVNDPAVATAEKGQLVYYREDLSNVWLKTVEGTAYVLLTKE